MSTTNEKLINLGLLSHYDEKIKDYIDTADNAVKEEIENIELKVFTPSVAANGDLSWSLGSVVDGTTPAT